MQRNVTMMLRRPVLMGMHQRNTLNTQSLRRNAGSKLNFLCRELSTTGPPPVNPQIGWWLAGCGGVVGGMVAVGGLTRLTKSGLSMTEWRLQGSMFPLNEEQWNEEFQRYQKYPEFQQRKDMSLNEFKTIFWWEYGHRMLGRFIGLCFVVPFTYFSFRRMIPNWLLPRCWGLLGLGATQGLVGWWMVKSGLNIETSSAFGDPNKEIRVSPYRLATHLGLALTTYVGLIWSALDVFKAATNSPFSSTQQLGRLPQFAAVTSMLVFATALSGAFVAGNDAGRAYNTFPKMTDDSWMPPDMFILTPIYRNFFENTGTVQFDHRCLAALTTAAVITQLMATLPKWNQLTKSTKVATTATGFALTAQVALGIATLLLYVPIPLAAAHQCGSLLLLAASLASAHALRSGPLLMASTRRVVLNSTSPISSSSIAGAAVSS
uniref:Uncharacterized protein n=1 Tax=Aureoumbra lagunensis TaxID=44058 RepID=A0A7S3JRB6_9STRA